MLPQNYLIGTKMYMAPKRRGTRLRFPLLSDSQPLIFCFALLANFYVAAAFYVKFPAAHLQKAVFTVFIAFFKFIVNSAAQADLSKPRPPPAEPAIKNCGYLGRQKNEADFRLRSILTSVLIKKDLFPTWVGNI